MSCNELAESIIKAALKAFHDVFFSLFCACSRIVIFHLAFHHFKIISVTIMIVYIHVHIYIFTVKPIFHHNRNGHALGMALDLGMTPSARLILICWSLLSLVDPMRT